MTETVTAFLARAKRLQGSKPRHTHGSYVFLATVTGSSDGLAAFAHKMPNVTALADYCEGRATLGPWLDAAVVAGVLAEDRIDRVLLVPK
jgi:hypothetical protein